MITDGAVHVRMIVRDMENVVPVWHIAAIMALFNQSDERATSSCVLQGQRLFLYENITRHLIIL